MKNQSRIFSIIHLTKILKIHLDLYGQNFKKNDNAFLTHLVNPPVGRYLEVHAGLCDGDLFVEFYATV